MNVIHVLGITVDPTGSLRLSDPQQKIGIIPKIFQSHDQSIDKSFMTSHDFSKLSKNGKK